MAKTVTLFNAHGVKRTVTEDEVAFWKKRGYSTKKPEVPAKLPVPKKPEPEAPAAPADPAPATPGG